MALDPKERFPTAAEMGAALDRSLDAMAVRAADAEIGELVTRAFTREREKLRAVLEAQLSAPPLAASARSSMLPSLAREETPASSQFPPSVGSSLPPPSSNTPPSATSAGQSRKRPWLAWGAIAGGAVLVVAVVAVAANRGRTRGSSPASLPLVGPSAVAADGVQVSIQAHPDDARILIDDVPVSSNPFRVTVPRDRKPHKISVVADGFAPEDRLVTYDRDVVMEVSLKKAATREVPSTSPAPAVAASQGVDPGSPLKTTGKPKHKIDENDPYKKDNP